MTVAELIRPGDKADIIPVRETGKSEVEGKLYKSKVFDIKENGNLEMSMPTERGKLVVLSLGVRMEIVFYTKNGLYRSVGQIRERYKSANLYIMEVELKTQPEKFQRREYYRFPCVMDFQYYTITKEEARFESAEALLIHLREQEDEDGKSPNREREYAGKIVDLSGGGTRFRTLKELDPRQWLLLEIHLKNEFMDKWFYIIGAVIDCVRPENDSERMFEVRVKFQIRDANMREEIIQFIFEEERKQRHRSIW